MATKSPQQFHSKWPNVSGPTELPNVSGATIQDAAVEVGDTCYSISDTMLYFCTTATQGAAVWASGGGGGGAPQSDIWLGGDYTYTQAATPVEEVTGNNGFDAVGVGSLTAYFIATLTNLWQQPGGSETVRVRLYDMGPALGPPDPSPRLVSELAGAFQSGPRGLVQALTVVSATPGTNDILDSARAYEVAIIHDVSTLGDVTYLGSAVLEVR